MLYELVIFDFDGTIVDSSATIALAANHALVVHGFAAREDDAVRALIGMPLERVMAMLGSAEAAAALSATYRAYWPAALERVPPSPFEGVVDAVGRVARGGARLAIATSRKREGLAEMMEGYGLGSHFELMLGGGCVQNGKPYPEMVERALGHFGVEAGNAVVVGDTTFDMQMGRAAGTDTCAVTYGSHSVDELSALQPTYLVHAPHEIPAVLGCTA